ncbi:hypothetical protein [Nocardioides nanhaiensis]|uniref:NADH:flavin oxidoreductase/NADH oxidase N-terminal domain-containing protein n=1 Tax=Nocardioides nanhaiensis TaxID=1476871 RepID=A0ABP8WEI7_9ACTN
MRGGSWLDEAVPFAQWLEADGTCDALEMTAGSSLLNPMYLFKGDAPVEEFAQVMPPAIRLGVRTVGKRLIRTYPYRDSYLLEDARQVRAAIGLPIVLLGGITDRAGIDRAVREGFEYVAMGRALLREPDLVARMEADATTPSLCIHCNTCMPTKFTGTRCVLVDRGTTRSADWGQSSSLLCATAVRASPGRVPGAVPAAAGADADSGG